MYDTLSYALFCQKNKRSFDIQNLTEGKIHHVTFYSCDFTKYNAVSYEFVILSNKTYKINKEIRYSSVKSPKCEMKSKHEYMNMHKKYVICIANMVEHPDYPFKNVNVKTRKMVHVKTNKSVNIPLAHKILYTFAQPVNKPFEKLPDCDILRAMFRYASYEEVC
nr:hypothetical protein MmNV_62 [Menippe mercenaria nudivirus]